MQRSWRDVVLPRRPTPSATAPTYPASAASSASTGRFPPLEGTKPDFAIVSVVARQMGVILEGTSASVVFEIMAADNPSFLGLSYDRLAEVVPQWPIVGRGDMYYGGTTYQNRNGLGVQLSNAAQRGEKFNLPAASSGPRPCALARTSFWQCPSHGCMTAASTLASQHSAGAAHRRAFRGPALQRRRKTWRGGWAACESEPGRRQPGSHRQD